MTSYFIPKYNQKLQEADLEQWNWHTCAHVLYSIDACQAHVYALELYNVDSMEAKLLYI